MVMAKRLPRSVTSICARSSGRDDESPSSALTADRVASRVGHGSELGASAASATCATGVTNASNANPTTPAVGPKTPVTFLPFDTGDHTTLAWPEVVHSGRESTERGA